MSGLADSNPSKRPIAEYSTGELLKMIADSARDHPTEDDPRRVAAWNEIKRRTDESEQLRAWHDNSVPIIAALAIYPPDDRDPRDWLEVRRVEDTHRPFTGIRGDRIDTTLEPDDFHMSKRSSGVGGRGPQEGLRVPVSSGEPSAPCRERQTGSDSNPSCRRITDQEEWILVQRMVGALVGKYGAKMSEETEKQARILVFVTLAGLGIEVERP